jgi:acetylornithine deacetylase/succinyl-diaminopimelate desuccinylase-like protein
VPVDFAKAGEEALALFRALLCVDTANPPGNERAAAEILAESLRQDGLEPKVFESKPARANLVVRRKGSGEKPPLLLTGHLDVVEAEASRWKHPPFAAEEEEGWLYGRGAVDMKNHVAASAMVMKLLAREGMTLKRDIIFAAVADEEAGCTLGSQFLVNEHADDVRAEYALGEIGGFTLRSGDVRVYPIQTAQKGLAWLKLRASGTTGHGSIPREDNAVQRLSRALVRIGNLPMPLHRTATVERFIRELGKARGFPASVVLPLILRPAMTQWVFDNIVRDASVERAFNAVLRNTASPTVLRAGSKTNVIPSMAEAEIDGRFVPGQTVELFLEELKDVIDDEGIEIETLHTLNPVETSPDSEMFRTLASAIQAVDPGGIVLPYMIPGFTDAVAFSRLKTTWYGFAPIVFPESPTVAFAELYHGDNERIPISGFVKGLEALYRAVTAATL